VAGGWKVLHNEELRNLYASQNDIGLTKSRRMRRAGHIACIGYVRNAYYILVGIPERTGPLERHRHRRKDIIKMNLREIGREVVDWMRVAQNRYQWRAVVNMVMNLRDQ
jgi:hypothetical protein